MCIRDRAGHNVQLYGVNDYGIDKDIKFKVTDVITDRIIYEGETSLPADSSVVIASVDAVSYTHLDVYKRQAPLDINETLNELLVKLFRSINAIEEQAIRTEEYKDMTTNDMHVIEAIEMCIRDRNPAV